MGGEQGEAQGSIASDRTGNGHSLEQRTWEPSIPGEFIDSEFQDGNKNRRITPSSVKALSIFFRSFRFQVQQCG